LLFTKDHAAKSIFFLPQQDSSSAVGPNQPIPYRGFHLVRLLLLLQAPLRSLKFCSWW